MEEIKHQSENTVFLSDFESLESYRKKLVDYCVWYLDLDEEAAKDCVQDAYVTLFVQLSKGIEIKNSVAWLYKAVLNNKNHVIRDRKKRNEFAFLTNEEKDYAMENAEFYEPYTETVTEEQIEEQPMLILSSLSEDERALYYAKYIENKKITEIAKAWKMNSSTLNKRHLKLKSKIIKMVHELFE